MYRRHNWDEDKWDIHSNKSTYAGHASGSKDSQSYHKNEMYGSKDEDKMKDGYRVLEIKEEEKEKENKEKTIVDNINQEEKYQKNEEKDEFQAISKNFQQESLEAEKDKNIKKKQHNSIEDAIKDAIKEEKEIVHVD